jgi:hypothetical protein
VYPTSITTLDMRQVFPFVLLFTMGPMYQSLPVIIKDRVRVKMDYFKPDMTPVRAKISLILTEITNSTILFDDVAPSAEIT